MISLKKLPTFSLFIGLPGCGKTTLASAFVRQALRRKMPVYSNVPIVGARVFTKEDIGRYDFSDDSGKTAVLILDEAGLEFDNRRFKDMFSGEAGQAMLRTFKLARHYNYKVILLSQTCDIDCKLKNLSGVWYLVERSFIPFCTVMHRVKRTIGINEEGTDLCDRLTLPKPILRLFSKRCFRPLYYKYFNSWDAPLLPSKDWEVYSST